MVIEEARLIAYYWLTEGLNADTMQWKIKETIDLTMQTACQRIYDILTDHEVPVEVRLEEGAERISLWFEYLTDWKVTDVI